MTEILVTGEPGCWRPDAGSRLVGELRAFTRPDQRTQLSFRECRDEAIAPLLGHAEAVLGTDLYLSVAVESQTGAYLGLIRLWIKANGPRFGFVGVLARWRRTRITYALVSAVFAELHRRGFRAAEAEIDVGNWASNALAARAGAVRVGGRYELMKRGWRDPTAPTDPTT